MLVGPLLTTSEITRDEPCGMHALAYQFRGRPVFRFSCSSTAILIQVLRQERTSLTVPISHQTHHITFVLLAS